MYWTMQAGLLMPIILKSVELLMLGNMVGRAAIRWSLTQLSLATTRPGPRTPPARVFTCYWMLPPKLTFVNRRMPDTPAVLPYPPGPDPSLTSY